MENNDDFLNKIGGPARGAFQLAGLTTLERVSKKTEKELLALHGVGPKAIKLLQPFLREKGLSLAKEK